MESPIKIAGLALAAILLTGCSAIPSADQSTDLNELRDSAVDGWDALPAISTRSRARGISLTSSGDLPESIAEMKLDFELVDTITVRDFIQILKMSGIQVAIGDESVLDTSFTVPMYEGSIGNLLNILSVATDLSFEWKRGVLMIDKSRYYMVKIPQDETIIKSITETIGGLGAEDIHASIESGSVGYKATNTTQERVLSFLERLDLNTAVVNLQLAVINVNLDRERRTGLDWSSLSLQAGSLGLLSESGTTDVSDGIVENAAEAGADAIEGIVGGASGTGVFMKLRSEAASLTGVLNLLSTYGQSQTMQNVTLKTLSSIEVALKSGDVIPYIGSVTTAISEAGSSSGAEVKEIETGFDITMTPHFNAEDRELTLSIALDLTTNAGFAELSAGNGLGSLSYPLIRQQEMESILRMSAGETALIGGLVYESTSDSRTGLAGLERFRIGSKANQSNKNAMFVLVRPTVVVFSAN